MQPVLAYILVVLFLVFQLALALGAPLGFAAWGGKYKVLPAKLRIGSFISALIFATAILIVLENEGLSSFLNKPAIISGFLFGFTTLFFLSAIANFASESKWEKRLMLPLACAMTTLCLILAIN